MSPFTKQALNISLVDYQSKSAPFVRTCQRIVSGRSLEEKVGGQEGDVGSKTT